MGVSAKTNMVLRAEEATRLLQGQLAPWESGVMESPDSPNLHMAFPLSSLTCCMI